MLRAVPRFAQRPALHGFLPIMHTATRNHPAKRFYYTDLPVYKDKYAHLKGEAKNIGVRAQGGKNKGDKVADKFKDEQQKKKNNKRRPGFGDPLRDAFTVKGLTKSVNNGERVILDDIYLNFYYGAKIGILGMNGAGKSTLMKIIAGVDSDYEGEIAFSKGLKIGYLQQEPELDETKSVKENVFAGVQEKTDVLSRYYEVKEELENDPEKTSLKAEFEDLESKVQKERLLDLQWQIERAMWALRCPPGDANVSFLSGGEKRRVALARLLISNPDILLLDEPTNHLDASSVAWLEQFLSTFPGTVIAITHDRYFLDNVAGWILEIENGQAIPFEGNYSEWLVNKQKRIEMEQRKEKVLERHLKEELEWVKTNPKGRQAKNKARLTRYEEMVENFRKRDIEAGVIHIPPGPRLGTEVLEVANLNKAVIDGVPATQIIDDDFLASLGPDAPQPRQLIKDLTFTMERGSIIGVIGPNGTGKTTLLKILSGTIPPDSGSIKIGKTVRMSLVSQERSELNPYNTVFEEIAEGKIEMELGDRTILIRQYVAFFNFKSDAQGKYIEDLSGGERNRVHLAKLLKCNANLLLLDEPTNDIDVEVLRSLEDGISSFSGCMIVVSHDRWFLDRVATHILAFEADGSVKLFEGGYSDYERERRKESKSDGKGSAGSGVSFVGLTKKGQKFS